MLRTNEITILFKMYSMKVEKVCDYWYEVMLIIPSMKNGIYQSERKGPKR